MAKGKFPQRALLNIGGAPRKGDKRPWEATWPAASRTDEVLALVELGCDRCDKAEFGQSLVKWVRDELMRRDRDRLSTTKGASDAS